jgi:hypothetical protein
LEVELELAHGRKWRVARGAWRVKY